MIAFAISTIFKNGIVSTTVSILLYFITMIITFVASGANWVKYISNTGTATVEIGKDKETVEISSIDQTFPLKGDLLFVSNIEPTVYVLVEWSEKDNSQHYTYLEFDYSECK